VVIADFVIGDETGIIKMRLRNGIIFILTAKREIYRSNSRRSYSYCKKLQGSSNQSTHENASRCFWKNWSLKSK